jgi:hypothetical protein
MQTVAADANHRHPGLKVSCLEAAKVDAPSQLCIPKDSAVCDDVSIARPEHPIYWAGLRRNQRFVEMMQTAAMLEPHLCDQAMCMSVVAKPNQSCLDHNCTRSAHALAQATIIVVPGQSHLQNFSMVFRTVVCNS